MTCKRNIGSVDRLIRLTLGMAIMAGGAYFGSLLGLLGLVPILTGLFRWCPIYCPLKISTDKTPEA